MRNDAHSKFLISLLLILSILTGCSKNSSKSSRKNERLYLDNTFYFAESDESSDINTANQLEYKPLPYMKFRNVSDAMEKGTKVAWIKSEFELPENLKNENLCFVIPYIHFAAKIYLNGKFIDKCGNMSGNLQEAGYNAHIFYFPKDLLNQDDVNTIQIKLLCLGQATISGGTFIGKQEDAKWQESMHTFLQSRVYIFSEGGLFSSFLLFTILFFFYKRERVYLIFAGLNITSMIFFANFFMPELPWLTGENGLPFLFTIKATKCLSFIFISFLFTLFVFAFLHYPHHQIERVLRAICGSICTILIIAARNYQELVSRTHLIILLSGIDVLFAFALVIRCLFIKKYKEKAIYLFISLVPLIITLITDLILREVFRIITVPYMALFGWQITIVFFFVYFSLQYKSIAIRMEYLNAELENEVMQQTRQLTDTNTKLQHERALSEKDLQTAALVQRKLFSIPEDKITKWDISVTYAPLSIVSGDLFNFYTTKDTLNGLSLFDASGHGVAASLVTMLSENIIKEVFLKNRNTAKNEPEKAMREINKRFISAKGEIENYMTGLLFDFSEQEDNSCLVTFSNAGHPSPLYYNAEQDKMEELLPDIENAGYGPVGISGFDFHYTSIKLTVKKDDILVLFTDGLTESMNDNRQEFGLKNVKKIIDGAKSESADSIMHKLMYNLYKHIGDANKTDDITVIILKRL